MGRFHGADDIYLTSNSIAVRKVKSGRDGRVCEDKTVYYPKTAKQIKKAEAIHGRLRNGR